MRILVINYEFPPLGGGASPQSYRLAQGMVQQGATVDVVTMGYEGLPNYEVVEGINIHRVKCVRKKKEMSNAFEQLTYLFSAYRKISQLIRDYQYDVCHCHFLIPTGVLAWAVKLRWKIPYIVTPHGSDVPGYNEDRFQLLHKFMGIPIRSVISASERIVFPSKFLRSLAKETIGFQVEKYDHIPMGLCIPEVTFAQKKRIILGTGRLLPRKGFQDLALAFSQLDDAHGFELHICGDGPMMETLENIQSQSPHSIILHGWIDNQSAEYINLLNESMLYALPSAKENASMSLLEAMAYKCAILTTNVSGCPETVGDDGLLVNPHDVENIRGVLDAYLGTPHELEERGVCLYNRLLDVFDEQKIFDTYYKIFQSIGKK